MFDLLVKGGTLPDGSVADIGITGDRIMAVGRLEAEAGRVIDATGDLVSPPFVDPHFHMDATLSYGLPRVNASGTLLEGIALWGELREVAVDLDQYARRIESRMHEQPRGIADLHRRGRQLGVERQRQGRQHQRARYSPVDRGIGERC